MHTTRVKTITIGTRASKLAMTQTRWIVQRLRQQWPDLDISIEQIHTTGDKITNLPLTQIGGDGVFVTEIEHALQERRIDLAVHSLKDLPTVQPTDLNVVVVGPREDVRDVFVSNTLFRIVDHTLLPLSSNPELAVTPRIGTCSLRRTAQIRAFCPTAQILSLRGNVDTRLRKLASGEYDGIVLASAGLHRLDMQQRLADRLTYFPVDMVLPAPGQGALALECRAEPEILSLLAPLQDLTVQAATSAERMFMRYLGAGCYLPVAAYAEVQAESITLRALVISLDGQKRIAVQKSLPWSSTSTIADAEQLGSAAAEQALAAGAAEIIRALTDAREQEQSHV